ncbi:MAG: sigma-70 family RNA polymerase sigma factor [Planctomycetes bacterium]|nr:sigma-70 family RNA polymerase sigma factor [Planctomycetota bacterium]
MSTSADDDAVLALLRRWHGGDRAALDTLVQRELPFLRLCLRERLGQALLARADRDDYLQDVVLEILTYAPHFVVGSAAAFRRLLAQIVENMLRDQHDFWSRHRRQQAKEQPLDTSLLLLDARARAQTTPSRAAARNEEQAFLRLALDLLDPEDRAVLVLREFEQLPFATVGARLGVLENTARMRFQRALGKLAAALDRLRIGFDTD